MRFTISDETGEMTVLDLLTVTCFMAPPMAGYIAGQEAGVVGIMIGIGVGLGPGVLAAYAFYRTVEYYFESEGRLKSQPWVVKKLIDLGIMVWTYFLIVAGFFMTLLLTRFIVQRMAG